MIARPRGRRLRPSSLPAWIRSESRVDEFLLAGTLILALTGAVWLIEPFAGYQAVALLYFLLVVLLGLKLSRGPVLMVASSSAGLWNFLSGPPYFTFHVQRFHGRDYVRSFFVVALAMGHLTSRLRRSEIFERQRERRTAALYELGDSAPGGAGLGLAIDDGFVRAHGGNVRAANGQSGGAEFIISIPVEILRPEIMESLE